jgi:hypothetical protein
MHSDLDPAFHVSREVETNCSNANELQKDGCPSISLNKSPCCGSSHITPCVIHPDLMELLELFIEDV